MALKRNTTQDGGDDRTLRLSALPFDAKKLEAYIRYATVLLSALGGPGFQVPGTEPFVQAHEASLKASGLTARELEALRSSVRRFTGNRFSVQLLKERLALAADPEVRTNLAEELARVEKQLPRRESEETISLLFTREVALMQLRGALGSWA